MGTGNGGIQSVGTNIFRIREVRKRVSIGAEGRSIGSFGEGGKKRRVRLAG